MGWESDLEGEDIFCLSSRKLLCFWGFLVPHSIPSTQASQVLFRQPPASPAVSLGSFLSKVSCLATVLLVQSKKTLNYLGSHKGISFMSSEEMRPGVQSTVGDNRDHYIHSTNADWVPTTWQTSSFRSSNLAFKDNKLSHPLPIHSSSIFFLIRPQQGSYLWYRYKP